MIYLPKEWIKDKNNLAEIYEIIELLEMDMVTTEIRNKKEKAIERLKKMGEYIIYYKVINKEINFG